MTPTRTLHFTNAWHAHSGGVRTFYESLLARAAADGRQMSVVVPGEADSTVELSRSTRLHTLKAPKSPVLDRRYRFILPTRYLRPRHGAIWRLMDRERPDLVEITDKLSLCHLAGIIKRRHTDRPTVVGMMQERFDDGLRAHLGEWGAARAFAAWYMGSVYLRQFDAHIANSHYTAGELLDIIERKGPGRPLHWRLRDRVHVAPLGVDASLFSPSLSSSTLRLWLLQMSGGTADSVLIAYAGRLSAEKRLEWLVPAVQKLVQRGLDARLVAIGGGPMAARLKRDAAEMIPGRFALVGHVTDRREFASLLASVDLFLHPNPSEPFGIGPLEAMASGVPVVVPMRGGVLSYANTSNAWLGDPSPEGLAAAAHSALTRGGEAVTRSVRALETARALTWTKVAGRYLRLYDEIHAARLARGVEPRTARDYRRTSTPLTTS